MSALRNFTKNTSNTISLTANTWNFISYPSNTTKYLDDVFTSPNIGDIIISQSNASKYIDGSILINSSGNKIKTGWDKTNGQITEFILEPNTGYKYFTTVAQNIPISMN